MNNPEDCQQRTNNRVLTAAELSVLEALDAIDVSGPASLPSVSLVELVAATVKGLHDDAKRNGRTAQRNRETDRSRREEGRLDYNLQRRVEYQGKVQAEGRDVRAYGVPDSEAKRRKRLDQIKDSKARRKARDASAAT